MIETVGRSVARGTAVQRVDVHVKRLRRTCCNLVPFSPARAILAASTQRFERWYMYLLAASVLVGLVIAVVIMLAFLTRLRDLGYVEGQNIDIVLQAWAKTVGPSPSICSLNRMPGLAFAKITASVALRASSGSRRRSSPFSSSRSKAHTTTRRVVFDPSTSTATPR